uniref:HTH luxR-type domain-containing protein n=1 Tax=Sphingobacterium sp. (strain 21) TaxID=743722 RepID=F4CFN2_SPHS2
MIKRCIFLWTLLCSFLLSLSAQENSLAEYLKKAYTARLKANYDLNLSTLKEAEQLKGHPQDPVLLAKLNTELSKQYLVNADYSKAKEYANKCLQLGQRIKNRTVEAYGYLAIATYYNYLDIGDLAVSNAQIALKLAKNWDYSLKSRAYYILYGVYSSWDDEVLSKKYAQLTILTAKENADNEMLANAYTAYATAMQFHYEKTKKRQYLDSMKLYLHKSASVYKKSPEQVGVRTYSIANINLANYFFEYQPLHKQSTQDSILFYADIAKKLARASDKNYTITGNVNGLLAEIASLQGKSRLAETYLMDSYTQLTKAATPSYYTFSNVAQGLSDLYAKRGDFKKALFYQKKKEVFTNKIFDERKMLQAKKLEAQYENSKLSEDIKIAAQKADSQRTQNLLLTGICLLLVISICLLVNSFKSKTKLQEEKSRRLQQEKQDAERNAELGLKMQAEEQARLQAEQQLLLLQKDQMQKEAMADALQIERKNRLLLQMKDKLQKLETEQNRGYVEKIIKDEMRLEETVERSAKEFESINPAFFSKLKEISNDKLTPLELKHCAYLRLQLNTKEIAAAFYIEPKSVRVSKYRIKQKIGLDKDTDLDRFLQELG